MQEIVLYPSGCGCGCGGVHINYHGGACRRRESDLGVVFETGCALIQQEMDGSIVTGPITLSADVENLEIIAEPEIGAVTYLGVDGEPIPQPSVGEPFYISVPATNTSYLVRLFAAVNNCTDDPDADIDLNRANRARMLAQMAVHSGMRRREEMLISSDSLLPPCYLVYAQMSFYINPKPIPCHCGCGCVNARVKGEVNDSAFSVPCCRCWQD